MNRRFELHQEPQVYPDPSRLIGGIAAEAADELDQQQLLLPFSQFQTYEETKSQVKFIIKAAIEKAYDRGKCDMAHYIEWRAKQNEL